MNDQYPSDFVRNEMRSISSHQATNFYDNPSGFGAVPRCGVPLEPDTKSLSISDAVPFAFYCLFLAAFYFRRKLCSSPWKWFLACLGRAELHSGELRRGSSQVCVILQNSSWGLLPSCPLAVCCSKIKMSSWALYRTSELRSFKTSEHFWGITLFSYTSSHCAVIKHLQNLSWMVLPVPWCFNDLCFSYLNEGFVTCLIWNQKRSEGSVPSPLIMHRVSVNMLGESTNP